MCNERNMLIIVSEFESCLTTVVPSSTIEVLSKYVPFPISIIFPFSAAAVTWFRNWKQFQECKLQWKVIYQTRAIEKEKKRDSEAKLTAAVFRVNWLNSRERMSERLNVTSSFRSRKMKTNHFLDRHRGAKTRQNELFNHLIVDSWAFRWKKS